MLKLLSKLSFSYLPSRLNPDPSYSDIDGFAQKGSVGILSCLARGRKDFLTVCRWRRAQKPMQSAGRRLAFARAAW